MLLISQANLQFSNLLLNKQLQSSSLYPFLFKNLVSSNQTNFSEKFIARIVFISCI